MRTIGLIGGMSWESSSEYYRIINESVKEKLGNNHSAKCILYSFDFSEIEKLQHEGKWRELTNMMIDAANKLKDSGAEFLVICTNTMHRMADDIHKKTNMEILHIVDTTAEEIKKKEIKKVGLLGTKFTMEGDFYIGRLKDKYDIEVIVPDRVERDFIHNVIYKELCNGIIKESSKEKFKRIIKNLAEKGAEGVILGCTEIPLLIKQEDVDIPIFDTTKIHAEYAVRYSLKDES